MAITEITAREAASVIKNGDNIGLSGFTACGTPKAVTEALAEIAAEAHDNGQQFKVNVFTGASTNDHVDGALGRAKAIDKRSPYQSTPDSRKGINAHDINYFDLHLSEMAQKLRYGFYGPMNVGIIEAADVTPSGEVLLGTGVGMSPTVAMMAEKVIIELNDQINPGMRGIHDLYLPLDPPNRREIPIYRASDRIGTPILHIDPAKIVGVVKTSAKDGAKSFSAPDDTTEHIAANVCDFLAHDLKAGRIPASFLPLQSGVGNVANAVLFGLESNPEIPAFDMYTEVIQDAVVRLMESGKCRFASSCSMSFSDETMDHVFANMDFFHDRIVLRPGEISNSPEVVRRLGVISMNTALEADIFGNVNSTHVTGTKMMN
ncbi:MAG: acetyl-CoA hydrolase, partial [Candidatus Amulumruptor caecigallinarius]|nr:acetyl-CoA hydrolase [Candidatus Amulumruptor caecigallinarius]